MFETIAGGTTAGRDHFGRKLFASILIHSLIVCALIIVPMIFFEEISSADVVSWVIGPPEPPALPTPPPAKPAGQAAPPRVRPGQQIEIRTEDLVEPSPIPPAPDAREIRAGDLPLFTAEPGPCPGCPVGGPDGPINPDVLGSFKPELIIRTPPPPPPTQARTPIRVTIIESSRLIHRVEPEYPDLARRARIQGTVQLRVLVSETGTVSDVEALSGHHLLKQAAVDAVRQWRYSPTILNGEPVAVSGMVLVNFVLRSN